MIVIETVPGIRSSIIAFGCAPVNGAVGKKQAKLAIDCALDHGINHFDLARSYGYGEAEKFVGKVLGDKRKDVVLTSKFGIKARKIAQLLSPLKPLVRKYRKDERNIDHSKRHGVTSSTALDKLHYRIPLDIHEMSKSLEESLKALKTDYLDYYFLHEPQERGEMDELLEMATRLKKEGKIRAFGLALNTRTMQDFKEFLEFFDLLQFNSPLTRQEYEAIRDLRNAQPNIIFSPIKGGAMDLSPNEKLLKLHEDFPHSVLLCSMFNPDHIKQNAELFSK